MVENENFSFHVSNKKRPTEVGLTSSDGVKMGSRVDNWKILNREKNNKLERERKQRLTIALKELQSLLPSEHISGIIQKLAIQHPTRNSKSNQYPNYLIAEAIVEYVGELQDSFKFQVKYFYFKSWPFFKTATEFCAGTSETCE